MFCSLRRGAVLFCIQFWKEHIHKRRYCYARMCGTVDKWEIGSNVIFGVVRCLNLCLIAQCSVPNAFCCWKWICSAIANQPPTRVYCCGTHTHARYCIFVWQLMHFTVNFEKCFVKVDALLKGFTIIFFAISLGNGCTLLNGKCACFLYVFVCPMVINVLTQK